VQRGPNGTFAYVLQADDKVSLRPIAVSHQTETLAVIAKGVDSSERVVTTGFARLKDGVSVKVADPDAPQAPAAKSQPGAEKSQASGDEGRAGVRTACAADIQKLCAGVEGGRRAIRDCLRSNAAQLSEACKAAAMREGGRRGGKGGDVSKAQGTTTE
jgi:multidrug efflux system membrane fusion protein